MTEVSEIPRDWMSHVRSMVKTPIQKGSRIHDILAKFQDNVHLKDVTNDPDAVAFKMGKLFNELRPFLPEEQKKIAQWETRENQPNLIYYALCVDKDKAGNLTRVNLVQKQWREFVRPDQVWQGQEDPYTTFQNVPKHDAIVNQLVVHYGKTFGSNVEPTKAVWYWLHLTPEGKEVLEQSSHGSSSLSLMPPDPTAGATMKALAAKNDQGEPIFDTLKQVLDLATAGESKRGGSVKEQVDEEKLGPLFELILNLDPDKSLDKPAEKGPLLKTGGESPSESFDIWSRLSQGRERTKQKELWTSPGFSYGQRQQQEQAQAKQISQVQAAKQRQRQEQLTLVPGSPNGYLISPFAEPGTDGRTIPAEQIPFQSLEFKYTWPQILQGLIEKNQEASPRKLAASLLQQQVNYQMRIGTLPPGHIDVTFVDDHNVKVRWVVYTPSPTSVTTARMPRTAQRQADKLKQINALYAASVTADKWAEFTGEPASEFPLELVIRDIEWIEQDLDKVQIPKQTSFPGLVSPTSTEGKFQTHGSAESKDSKPLVFVSEPDEYLRIPGQESKFHSLDEAQRRANDYKLNDIVKDFCQLSDYRNQGNHLALVLLEQLVNDKIRRKAYPPGNLILTIEHPQSSKKRQIKVDYYRAAPSRFDPVLKIEKLQKDYDEMVRMCPNIPIDATIESLTWHDSSSIQTSKKAHSSYFDSATTNTEPLTRKEEEPDEFDEIVWME